MAKQIGARHASQHQPVLNKPKQVYARRRKIYSRMQRLRDPRISYCRHGHRGLYCRRLLVFAQARVVCLAGAVVLRDLAGESVVPCSSGAAGPQAERRPLSSSERLAEPGAPPNSGPARRWTIRAPERGRLGEQNVTPLRVMQSPSAILYDSGRFPLWFEFLRWFLDSSRFGCSGDCRLRIVRRAPGIFLVGVHGSLLFGSLGCFAIAALWIFVWFAQLRLLFDATQQESIVSKRGYLRWHEHHVALAGAREFHIRHVVAAVVEKRTWRVRIIFTDGRTEQLVEIDSRSKAESLAESLRSATNLPVTIYDDAA